MFNNHIIGDIFEDNLAPDCQYLFQFDTQRDFYNKIIQLVPLLPTQFNPMRSSDAYMRQ